MPQDDYELLDAGDGRRLERFGPLVLDRPAPGATEPRRDRAGWGAADLRFDPELGWAGRADASARWSVQVAGLTMELRPTTSGGVGLYPEHAANLAWLAARLHERTTPAGSPTVLNLFAHTGLVTIAAASVGAAVAHVDATRTSLAWARRNAALNGLAEAPIRWLADDATAFVEREGRRGRRYDAIALDPPSFGRADGRSWSLREDLPRLLTACATIAADEVVLVLTAHSTGLEGSGLASLLEGAFADAGRPEVRPMELRAVSGASLRLGWVVRGVFRRNAAP